MNYVRFGVVCIDQYVESCIIDHEVGRHICTTSLDLLMFLMAEKLDKMIPS